MREIALILWIIVISLDASMAGALSFSADLAPQVINFSNNTNNYTITVSGTFDNHVKLIAKISGPERSYRVVEREKRYGIWTSSPPQFVRNISSYCQVLVFKDIEKLVLSNSLKYLEKYSDDFLCNERRGIEQAVADKLTRLGLYSSNVNTIELVADNFYRFEFTIPVYSAEGSYEVDILGFNDSEELVAHKKLKFIVKKDSHIEHIKTLAVEYPVMYAISVVLLAITAGALAGFALRFARKNGAKQQ